MSNNNSLVDSKGGGVAKANFFLNMIYSSRFIFDFKMSVFFLITPLNIDI